MKKEVFAYLHTHWDREWYKTFEEYRFRLIAVLDDIFEKIEKKEINSFYLDGQTIALDDYLEIFPEKTEYVINLIKNQKLYIGPFYALADEFLVNGESLARNLLIGINSAKKYGANNFIGYLPDAFGHCAWMPMLFNKTNIKNALVWRGVGEENQEFIWESPDGSRTKTGYLIAGYFQDYFSKKSYKKNINNILENLSKYAKSTPILLPIGADHLACSDIIKSKIKNLNRNNHDFKIKLSSLEEYFETTKNNTELNIKKGELRDNSKSYILPSVFSSRIDLKQYNMTIQWLLGKLTEPLNSICYINNQINSYQNQLDYAWKILIQNHAHDSICGCSLDAVHQENIMRFKKVEQLCNTAIENTKFHLAKNLSKKDFAIINLSNFNYQGVYSFYSSKKMNLPIVKKFKAFPNEISQDIHNIPVQENYKYYYEYLAYADNIAPLSIETIYPKLKKDSTLKCTETSLENEFIKLEINKDGSLNLTDKLNNKSFNNIHQFSDEADVGDSYNFSPILKDKKLFAKFINSKIVENNTLRKKLKLEYHLNIPSHAINNSKRSSKKIKHKFFVEVALSENSKRIDFVCNYENFSKDHILKLNLALPKEIENVLSEDVFGTINRLHKKNYDYKKLLPAKRFTEIDLNTNAFQRFVNTQGLTILTKGLQEYEVDKNNLNITLLRSIGVISKKALVSRNAAAGPPLPAQESQMLGKQQAQYSICFTNEITEMFKEADYYYNPLLVVEGTSNKTTLQNHEFLKLPNNFYLYSLKQAENRDGFIAKIFNLSDKTESLTINDKEQIFEVNILEENINTKNLNNKQIDFKTNELKILFLK